MHQTDPVYKIQEVDFVAATKNNNSMDMYSGYSGSGGKKHKMMNFKNQFLLSTAHFYLPVPLKLVVFSNIKKM